MHRHRAGRLGWKLAYLFVVVALATAGGAMMLLKGAGTDASLTVAGPGPLTSVTPPPTVPLDTATPTPSASPTTVVAAPAPTRASSPPPVAVRPSTAPSRTVTAAPRSSAVAAPTTAAPVAPPSQVASSPVASSPVAPPSVATATFALQVVTLTNAQRLLGGCAPLRGDPALTAAAQGHSTDMAAHGYFDHDGRDGSTPFDRIRAAGYTYSLAGENIAAGQPTPAAVVAAWMASPGHRANILNCAFRDIGVGYAAGGGYGAYWTQDFGAPAGATR